MEFTEFRDLVCGKNKMNQTKAILGFILLKPEQIEYKEHGIIDDNNEEEGYELCIDTIMTIQKPELNLQYITDIYGDHEFIQMEIKFLSSYDPDLKEIYDMINNYEKDLSENYDDYKKCPAFAIQVLPADIYSEDRPAIYMEFQMPIMLSLTSSETNRMPDTIKILFDIDKCYLHEEDLVDKDDVKREVVYEQNEAQKEAIDRLKEIQDAEQRKEREKTLIEHLNDQNQKENTIKVGRAALNIMENNNEQDT